MFDIYRNKKHLKGSKEHGDWLTINPNEEFMDELLDLTNYSLHPNFRHQILGSLTRIWARFVWKIMYGKTK